MVDFDLDKRKVDGEQVPYLKTPLSVDEKMELLKGYFIVPNESWQRIPLWSHIRYTKKEGNEFVRGGFIKAHKMSKEGKPLFEITNTINKNGAEKKDKEFVFYVYHDKVSKVYKKISYESVLEIEELTRVLKLLTLKVDNLETKLNERLELGQRAIKRKSVELRKTPKFDPSIS